MPLGEVTQGMVFPTTSPPEPKMLAVGESATAHPMRVSMSRGEKATAAASITIARIFISVVRI